jgi:hypothetical protein
MRLRKGATQGPPGPPLEQLIRHLFIDEGQEYSRTQMLQIMGHQEHALEGLETLKLYYHHHPICVHGKGGHIRCLFDHFVERDGADFVAHYKRDYLYWYYDPGLGGTIFYLRDQQKIRFRPNGYPVAVNYSYTYDWQFPPMYREEQPQ